MNSRTAPRSIAAAVTISLLIATPGGTAWAQTARMVRPASLGAGTVGAAVAGTSLQSGAGLSAPALSPSALSLSAPSIAPSPMALGAAVIPAPAATVSYGEEASLSRPVRKGPAAAPSALQPAPLAALSVAGESFAPALAAAGNPAPAKTEGVLGRLSAMFDGLAARKPVQDAVAGGENGGGSRGSGLNPHGRKLIPVLVTLADPGSPEALLAVAEKLEADAGFRVDSSFSPVRTPGLVTLRGAVPVAGLLTLKKSPGVVDIQAAYGAPASMTPASASGAAPAPENLLRAGLRRLMTKNPMLGAVAMLPLQFLVMVAFMGPVMGGIALGGAAAVLKPWMLGTALGMASSYSFLSPLFRWIPLKYRVIAAHLAAATGAYLFFGIGGGLVAVWALANVVLSAAASVSSISALEKAGNSNPIDRAVNSTEAAAFVNLLGFSALIPILALGGMLPLAIGILAVSTALAASLLIKSRPKTPALADAPPSAPSTPEPGPGAPAAKTPAAKGKAPTHPPFVPATRVVAEMEKLFASDPAAGLKAAAAAVLNEKERRAEVKIGAMRLMDQAPFAKSAQHYADLLKLATRSGIQTSKEVNVDPWWYLQREALKKMTREAESLKPGQPELVDLLKASYKDRNASVRLAAAEALAALGVDPGVEPNYQSVRAEQPQVMRPAPDRRLQPQQQPLKPKTSSGQWVWILILSAIIGWMTYNNLNRPAAPPVTPPAIEQVIRPDSTAAAPVVKPTEQQSLEEIARNTDRTADAIERQAQAIERQAKATEELAKPKGSNWGNILMMLAMAILPIFLLVWLLKRMQGGGSAPGGVKMAPKMDLEKPTTRFDDVAGIDETMVEVQEILDFLREPGRFKKLGARMPKGILMEGPPGTGKTLLARALAGETDATFISISGSDFVELYVGMGARRVRELFETARQNAPAIIFIDEIDAVGKKRGDGGPGNGGNDEREQTINQILKEMDGFDNSSGVLVVAATNRADTLDAALTRPGRFDRKIHVGMPEAMGREAILALHAKKARLGPDVDLRLIARRTAGLSGAFLENVINEAALLAARRGGDAINLADMDEAVDRATIGGKRSLRLSDALKRRIAAHEAGHVLANLLNEKPELRSPVNKVTIIPHGSGALGFAESGGEDGERYLYTRGELEARLDTALGGLIAEKIFYGEWSTGPGSDLESATRVARAMVQQLGMDAELGLAQTGPNQYGQSAFGSEIDAKAHAAVNALLKASMERTEKRLRDAKDKHEAMIEALMEKETLSADEIQALAHPKPK